MLPINNYNIIIYLSKKNVTNERKQHKDNIHIYVSKYSTFTHQKKN